MIKLIIRGLLEITDIDNATTAVSSIFPTPLYSNKH